MPEEVWLRHEMIRWQTELPDERIILPGNLILIVMALVGSVSGFFVFGQQTEEILKRTLRPWLNFMVYLRRTATCARG